MSKRKASILIVDDETEIVRALHRSLTGHGYEVLEANDGEKALSIIETEKLDLLLLDLQLPGISGLEICKRVREQSNLPIIIISVKNRERDKVLALDLGADDYVSKPFGINEVLARIRVALRHSALMISTVGESMTIGELSIDFSQRLVQVRGQEVRLTPTEYDLLKIFVTHRGKIMTQHMLLEKVWGVRNDGKASYLHVYIGQLRRKIETDPTHPRLLQTISGVGYRFNED